MTRGHVHRPWNHLTTMGSLYASRTLVLTRGKNLCSGIDSPVCLHGNVITSVDTFCPITFLSDLPLLLLEVRFLSCEVDFALLNYSCAGPFTDYFLNCDEA